ncbi:MAG: hypothetical protein IT369_19130 [Candidatus Latescibacteria bacterium]|nr:hypothetical protein [Candidatus Latescibacterota bacterium]
MKNTLLMLVGMVGMGAEVSGEELQQALMRLQDRLHSAALESVLGSVDYEYVYAVPGNEEVVLLEEIQVERPALPDTGKAIVPDEGQALAQGNRQARLAREDLPVELRLADVVALKGRYKPQVGLSEKVYLGVRAVARDERFSGERLSLAETELSMEERRQLRWDTHELFRNWPGGSVLFLEAGEAAAQGDAAEVPVYWSFRRPGPPPFDKPEVLASGMMNLSLRKVGEEWKVSHIERLIAALHTEVVKVQK